MKKNRSRSLSVLASAVCSALAPALIAVSCQGTETDNPVAGPVFDGTSPENFSPAPGGTPPCNPTTAEEEAMIPRALARTVVVPSASGTVVATGTYAGGLSFIDVSDPDAPVELSRGVVRGEIHQLLFAASGELWVLATEPPSVSGGNVPSATGIDPVLRLVRVDVSDPARPVRIGDVALEGDAWELRERNGEVWVLSARRDESQRGCSAPPNLCGFRYYEALLLHGFRPNGAVLEPLGDAELPFTQRAWWGSDGVVTAPADGTLRAVGWDSSGALRGVVTVSLGGDESLPGPVEVVDGELSVVRAGAGQARIDVYDLDSGAASPLRSSPLGARTGPVGIYSLFADGYLWLQPYAAIGSNGPIDAELWDLTGATPAAVPLSAAYHMVLPIEGATRAGAPDEILALGWTLDTSTGEDRASLLSIQGSVVSVIDAPELGTSNAILRNGGTLAPVGLTGAGDAPAWRLNARGLGLPIGIDPSFVSVRRYTQAFVGVAADGAPADGTTIESGAVTGVELIEYEDSNGFEDATALDITRGSTGRRVELSPRMEALVPTATGVITVAITPVGQCEQAGADCSGYAPGVSVFDLTGDPTLVATLPFPELPLPPADANRVNVSWEMYDYVSQRRLDALELGPEQLGFVANVYLTCDDQADCDALELTAVPIREANVIVGGTITCPPSDIPTDCVPGPAPVPSVYGMGQRQYFYVLDLAAPGGPAWQVWGVSRLDATAARTDRDSRFAVPIATDGVLAATRLERRRSATDVNDRGATRFFLDRFERSPSGDVVALPPVNVPGYPLARLGGGGTLERWLSVEAAPNETGEASLYRLNVQSDGARIEQRLDLDGNFAGFRAVPAGDGQLGLVLVTPDDGCGTSELSAIQLGSDPNDASEPFAIASTLELPADGWALADVAGNRALLRRGFVYVLVQVGADGTLAVASSGSVDVSVTNEQLLGTSLYAGAGQFGQRVLDLSGATP